MNVECPILTSTSPLVELFLPITNLSCLTRYSNSFPCNLAMGWRCILVSGLLRMTPELLPPEVDEETRAVLLFLGEVDMGLDSLRARRAHASLSWGEEEASAVGAGDEAAGSRAGGAGGCRELVEAIKIFYALGLS